MQAKMQQRLVGLLILLAISLIFLPLLFHNTYPSTELDRSPSSIDRDVQNEQKEKKTHLRSVKKESMAVTATSLSSSMKLVPLSLSPTHSSIHRAPSTSTMHLPSFMVIPKAWCLQVGTFRDPARVRRLLQQLRHRGYDAYTHERHNSQGIDFIDVFVGPEVHKERVLKLKKQLWQECHLHSVVRFYKVRM